VKKGGGRSGEETGCGEQLLPATAMRGNTLPGKDTSTKSGERKKSEWGAISGGGKNGGEEEGGQRR